MTFRDALQRAVTFLRSVAARTRNTGLARTAGSLAFTTVLGIVPMATVAFAFVARFPVFQQWLDVLETFLLKYTLPGGANEVVHHYVREFTEKAAGLTGLSIVFILVTATLVIATIEREINALWGIGRKRPMARRLAVYLVGTTLGPVLVGASISLTTWLFTQSLAAVPMEVTLTDFAVKPLPLDAVHAGAGVALCAGAQSPRAVAPRVRRRLRGGAGVRGREARLRHST